MKEYNRNIAKPPIVVIGASTGGTEAVVELLTHLPINTGMAYLYIQHPDGGEELAKLLTALSQATAMPVVEAVDFVSPQPNHLYIMPGDRNVFSTDGILKVEDKPLSSPRMPIDSLFAVVAEKYTEASIGIILSGSSLDGTIGLKAIRQAGGLTFAQDETARFQSMPKMAAAEGAVDLILPPAEIAEEIARIARQKELYYSAMAEASESSVFADEEFQEILLHLYRAVGVDFRQYKMNTIRRRVIRRMMLHRLEKLTDYYQYLKQNPRELELLYQDFLINVTTFFRDKAMVEYLSKNLFPQIFKTKGAGEPIRIWVAACSTGQEVYSLAILLFEIVGLNGQHVHIQIFASDLSESAVKKARLGVYSKAEMQDVPEKYLQKYFTRTDGHYRVVKSIKDVCVFATHNVAKDPPFSKLDLISCCNLLIYFENSLQKKVVNTFHYSLNSNGYLILGQSETIGGSGHLFSTTEKNLKVYAKKKDAIAKAMFETSFSHPRGVSKLADIFETPTPQRRDSDQKLETVVDKLLLKRYTPAAVLVDEELNILQFRGAVGIYLEPSPGKASLNLVKMARAGLGVELRGLVLKARKSGEAAKKEAIGIMQGGKKIVIEIVPVKEPDSNQAYYLVVFGEEETQHPVDASVASDLRVARLEGELTTLREDMCAIIEAQEAANEELQSANEEVVSSNEELQSITEELETSKEEIESSNEELITINQELQERNEQLTQIQEYSEAIFRIMREGLLVLDKQLRILNANRAFYRTFKVKEEETLYKLLYEVGNKQWDIAQLRHLLDEVIPQNSLVENFEVRHVFPVIGEKVMLLNAVRMTQNIHGKHLILLTIEDVTEFLRKDN